MMSNPSDYLKLLEDIRTAMVTLFSAFRSHCSQPVRLFDKKKLSDVMRASLRNDMHSVIAAS